MGWIRNITILFSLVSPNLNHGYAAELVFFCLEKFYQLAVPAEKIAEKALKLALLPPSEKAQALKGMSRTELIVMANTALRASFGMIPLDESQVQDAFLYRIHPSLTARSGSPPVSDNLKKQFQLDAAKSLLAAYKDKDGTYQLGIWKDLVRQAMEEASAHERRQIASALFKQIKTLPQHWQPQTRFDQFIDEVLGIKADQVTERIKIQSQDSIRKQYGDELVWSEFGNRYLLTPYFEFQHVVDKLNPKPGQLFVDLGSGLGRQGIYLGVTRPEVNFHGYEIVGERVSESERAAKNLELPNVKFFKQDLSDTKFRPEAADYYFAFNPVSGATFLKILNDLREQSVKTKKPFSLVLALSKDVDRVLEQNSGFKEFKYPAAFEDDDFARFFRFDPDQPWTPFAEEVIQTQKQQDRNLNPAAASSNNNQEILKAAKISKPRPLNISDQNIIERTMNARNSHYSNLSFASLWGWNPSEHYTLYTRGNALIIAGNQGEGRFVIEPLGVTAQESAQIIRQMLDEKTTKQFKYVSHETAELLKSDPSLEVTEEPNARDYIYQAAQLAMLATPKTPNETTSLTKDLRYKRNKALELNQRVPPPQFQRISTQTEKESIISFMKVWGETQTGKTGREELSGAIRMVENIETFHLDCFALIQDGKIIGVTLGKKTGPDTYTVFVEKALTEDPYVGAYPLLAGLSAKEALSQKLTKINRMDDEGEAHLRKAKEALNPSERPPVYRVTKRNPQ